MALFDDIERTETRPARYNEPEFEYYNLSALPWVAAIRTLSERWFERFPESAKADVRARFRSADNGQHCGAFFELYIHQLLLNLGYQVQVHPEVGAATRPDFLAKWEGCDRFYVECTLALPAGDETAAETRINRVYDTLNELNSPNFFLSVQVRGELTESPPAAPLRPQLERWLATLDPDEVHEAAQDAPGFDCFPAFPWEHAGCRFVFRAIPKSAAHRGTLGVRPIGIRMGQARWLATHDDIRNAVNRKATRYGSLAVPLVIAVNVLTDFCDEFDIMNGLFGQECVTFTQIGEEFHVQQGDRRPDGAFRGPAGAQNSRVSAVLVAARLVPASLRAVNPELYHNPWATHALPADALPLPQHVPNLQTGVMKRVDGLAAGDILAVPAPWPVPDE